jgi:hypothetical protein
VVLTCFHQEALCALGSWVAVVSPFIYGPLAVGKRQCHTESVTCVSFHIFGLVVTGQRRLRVVVPSDIQAFVVRSQRLKLPCLSGCSYHVFDLTNTCRHTHMYDGIPAAQMQDPAHNVSLQLPRGQSPPQYRRGFTPKSPRKPDSCPQITESIPTTLAVAQKVAKPIVTRPRHTHSHTHARTCSPCVKTHARIHRHHTHYKAQGHKQI